MAVTNIVTAGNISAAASTTLTYGSAVTAGSTLVAGAFWANLSGTPASPAISDSVNGTWTSASWVNAGNVEVAVKAFPNTGAGTPVVTFNPNGASADIGGFFILEVTDASGVDRSGVTSSQPTTNVPFVASGVLVQANEVLIAVMTGDHGGSPSVTSLAGDGTYTTIIAELSQAVQFGHAQYKVVASTASDQADWTVTPAVAPNPGNGVSVLISIKVAGSAAQVPYQSYYQGIVTQ